MSPETNPISYTCGAYFAGFVIGAVCEIPPQKLGLTFVISVLAELALDKLLETTLSGSMGGRKLKTLQNLSSALVWAVSITAMAALGMIGFPGIAIFGTVALINVLNKQTSINNAFSVPLKN